MIILLLALTLNLTSRLDKQNLIRLNLLIKSKNSPNNLEVVIRAYTMYVPSKPM
jgi:hypothetical protein